MTNADHWLCANCGRPVDLWNDDDAPGGLEVNHVDPDGFVTYPPDCRAPELP